jgi:ABC-type dipeptide/oligopeptide/nickel transport system permease component
MSRVIAYRILGSIAAIIGASLLAFLIMRVLPGDPARQILGPLATPTAIAEVNHELGLDEPIFTQYIHYITDFFRGDWGYSYALNSSVKSLFVDRFPATIELALFSFLITMTAAVGLALLSTYRHRPVTDMLVRGASYIGFGTPPFFLALLLLIIFFKTFHVLPGPEGRLPVGATPPPTVTHLYSVDALLAGQFNTFWESFQHLLLPAIALGIGSFSFIVRLLRANLLEVSREPFLLVARGKGLPRWTAFRRHALPNAFLPTLTSAGLVLGEFLAGSVLVERVFDWPGIGSLVFEAIVKQDFAIVQAFILLSAVIFVLVNLLVDILYAVIDPRVRIPAVTSS